MALVASALFYPFPFHSLTDTFQKLVTAPIVFGFHLYLSLSTFDYKLSLAQTKLTENRKD